MASAGSASAAQTGPGGLLVTDEHAHVANTGKASATTGDNATVGNKSRDLAVNSQSNSAGNGFNQASNSNWSGGTSTTRTGAAMAVGNNATVSVSQAMDDPSANGVALISQNFDAPSVGRASAVSGLNSGTGNASANAALTS